MNIYTIEFTYEQAERIYEDTHTKFWSNRSRDIIYTLYRGFNNGYGATVNVHHTMVCILLSFYDHINDLREENSEEPDAMAVEIAELLRKHVASAI
ncbi:predicted ORF [Xanthomonas phage XacN1]|nr:predicted ORF [Xanthomonas phage XacN1]BBA65617.1 predicted ORF [Xanthomonas phage XacN1]